MRLVLLLLAAAALCAQSDPAQKAKQARDLVLAGKAEEAIPIYLELARAAPNDAAMLVNLCIAEFKARRFRDAAGHAEAALKLQPDSLAANLFLGSSYTQLGEYARAVSPLEKVIAAQPNDRNARVMLGEALLALERFNDSAIQFRRASELAPENPAVWYGLGRAFEALAARAFQQLEIAAPDSPYWQALAAETYFKKRRYGSAFDSYHRALTASSTLRGLHAGLADIYRRTGHADWAAIEEQRERESPPLDCGTANLACDFAGGHYREIVESASQGPESLYWTSKSYNELARQAYDRLLQLPSSLQTHLHAALMYDGDGLYRQASAEWREALRLAPDSIEAQTGLAWSLFRGGDFEAALPLLREFVKSQPGSRDLQFLCGASLLNLDQPEKAIPFLETAATLEPQFLPAQAALGHALLLAGKAAYAIPHLQAALPSDEDAAVHFQLLRAYQLTGQTALARQALTAYQEARTSSAQRKKMDEGGFITPP
ncbi:MAG TPA: tetratricopeptide repeat protein [Bryobacteraceae bacterium]|nr:tetratricopeptide repeat protein [Bryobacteraceae bacterium]